MNYSLKYYAATFCLIIPLEGCEASGNTVDWDGLNYAAAECGENSEDSFISADCKASGIEMNAAGMHHSGHR